MNDCNASIHSDYDTEEVVWHMPCWRADLLADLLDTAETTLDWYTYSDALREAAEAVRFQIRQRKGGQS